MPSNFVGQSLSHFVALFLCLCVPKPQGVTLSNLLTKDVPKKLIISSKSIRLLDAVGQGTLTDEIL